MDTETLKLLGNGSAQLILAAGYLPVLWLVRVLWKDRADLADKVYLMLGQQYDDASKRKDLWDQQRGTIETQTQSIRDLERSVEGLRSDLQRVRP